MKTTYEIRSKDLNSIIKTFYTSDEAIKFWEENVRNAGVNDILKDAFVVRHSWEPKYDAETARLDWLLSEGSLSAIYAECKRAPALYKNREEWLNAAREAIDICRKAPEATSTVIWPQLFNFECHKPGEVE